MALLSDKVALITGASRGIGAATARTMAEAGARLLLVARSREALAGIARELPHAQTLACDVSDHAAVTRAVALAGQTFGRLDILVNNAGIIDPIGPLATSDPDEWRRTTEVNFLGIYNGLRAALPVMRDQGGGVIVNLSSGAAHRPLEGWSAYCATKAGAFMLTRAAHLENESAGVRVMSLSPGTVATDMQRRIRASGVNPVSRMDFSEHKDPSLPARAIVWLCTEQAADLAGEEVSLRAPEILSRMGLG